MVMLLVACAALLMPCDAFTPKTMRAAVATGAGKKEGDFSKIKVVDRSVPQPGQGQVLIRVAASSVNPVDWKIMGSSILTALTLFGPKVMGFDVAGTVEAAGPGCSRLKVGDEVWADLGKSSIRHPLQLGAWADYALADESQVGLKSSKHNFTEAASLPLASLTDYQAFKQAGAPWTGKKNLTVVITSGAGGTGTPAIQLAKHYGATRIITASSPSNFELLKSLGATDVFDYHKTTIWKELKEDSVDFVYDNYGAAATADAAMPSLRSGGVFLLVPGKGGALSKNPKAGVNQIMYGLCDSSKHEDLDALKAIADLGHLKAVVQQSFPLEDIHGALGASFSGHAIGKIAVVMAQTAAVSQPTPVEEVAVEEPIRPCHAILKGYYGPLCVEEDRAGSCETVGMKPFSCTASGWPVCCIGHSGGDSNNPHWYKAGQKCSDLHPDGAAPFELCNGEPLVV